MRSIKQKLLVRILAMTAAAALICGGVGIAANYISSHSMLEQSLESTASLAATRVSYELLSYQNAVRGLGMVPELSDGAVPVTEKERIVDHWAQSYGMERGNLLDLSGRSLFDGNSYSDRAYFQQAVQGGGLYLRANPEQSYRGIVHHGGRACLVERHRGRHCRRCSLLCAP